jgi:tetratricopeptide (TPR) repeat protein
MRVLRQVRPLRMLAPAIAALCGSLDQATAVAQPPDRDPSLARYVALVETYARGERAAGVAGLGAWRERDLKGAADRLAAGCIGDVPPPPSTGRDPCPLAWAVLLHAERAKTEREDAARLLHLELATRLAGQLLRARPEEAGLVRAFYVAMVLWAHREERWATALDLAARGRKLFPRDPELLLEIGSLEESVSVRGSSSPARSPEDLAGLSTTPTFRTDAAERAERERHLMQAESALAEAVAADPAVVEARLRLGRVLWRRGKPDAARQGLAAVLGAPAEPTLVYLAHLFLGRVDEDAGRIPEAEDEYRAALESRPHAQTPEIALAHLRQDLGDDAGAGAAIGRALESTREAGLDDPFWYYSSVRPGRAEARFEDLIREASR